MADDHGPKLTPQTFVFQKISNHGASNPIVARLCMQTMHLVKGLQVPEKKQGTIVQLYMELHRRLLQCYDIQQRMIAADEETKAQAIKEITAGNRTLPYLVNLETEAESFLNTAKQYLRDLVQVVNLLFDEKFPVDAKVWWDKREAGNSELVVWARKRFGPTSFDTKMLEEEDAWISELIRKRNASEHPGEKSGTLKFQNYRQSPIGAFISPIWWREGKSSCAPSPVLADISTYIENLLTLAEDLLANALAYDPETSPVVIGVIPPEKRDKLVPIRLQTYLNPKVIPPLPSD